MQSATSSDTAASAMQSHLLWVVALQAEATPLIEHYQLKARKTRAYRLYESTSVTLIICGIGELAAASATSYALGSLPHSSVAINIGVAGSDHAIGTIYHASSIAKQTMNDFSEHSKGIFYPQLPFKTDIPGLAIKSVGNPCTAYQPDQCFEMEAYGFCFAARQFLAAEQVQCLKIISDNPTTPLYKSGNKQSLSITKAAINDLMTRNLVSITRFAGQLLDSSQTGFPQMEQLEKTCDRFIAHVEKQMNNKLHFTRSQQEQLGKLIRRYQVLGKSLPQHLQIKNGSELISALDNGISTLLPEYNNNKLSKRALKPET